MVLPTWIASGPPSYLSLDKSGSLGEVRESQISGLRLVVPRQVAQVGTNKNTNFDLNIIFETIRDMLGPLRFVIQFVHSCWIRTGFAIRNTLYKKKWFRACPNGILKKY